MRLISNRTDVITDVNTIPESNFGNPHANGSGNENQDSASRETGLVNPVMKKRNHPKTMPNNTD